MLHRVSLGWAPLAALAVALPALAGCVDGSAPVVGSYPLDRPAIDRTYLRDRHGRYIHLHGVNASCTTKVPAAIDAQTKLPTYVGRPFPLDKAEAEFRRMRDTGFNAIRLLVIWEGVEPEAKGKYDQEYLAYIREIVKLAGKYEIWVLMDMHQDMFSRHLFSRFNRKPARGQPGSMEHMLLSLVEPYNATVGGDGAPKWAVQACLQEKKLDSPNWGIPRLMAGMNVAELEKLTKLLNKLTGQPDDAPLPPWSLYLVAGLPKQTFPVEETSDVLPFTNWGLAHSLSLDVARCYACLLAGDKVFPTLKKDGKPIQDYLQQAYADAWAKVAEQVKDLPNVLGYDLMNEPGGNFITLSAAAALIKTGATDGVGPLLEQLLGPETGPLAKDALLTLKVLPPDTKPETLRRWGLADVDPLATLALNNGFDENHLRPFYERVARAINAVDPKALFFVEGSMNLFSLTGGAGGLAGFWEVPMTAPRGFEERTVWAPHWYPDIYPFPGFNVDPRPLRFEQVRYRDYRPKLEEAASLADYSLGKVPVVFGEFGTYFNFGNTRDNGKHVDNARASGYETSAAILNNYYEAFESMFQSHIQWCYSTENDPEKGDLWNGEDFSVIGPDRQVRAERAWARPYARALAGKPHKTHFHSDYHYFDPNKGEVVPKREFYVAYGSKESSAPTEIVVPRLQYPKGFYVWVSDGHCHFDAERSILYHFPARDEPGAEHWVRLRPPLAGADNAGFAYFFDGDKMVRGSGATAVGLPPMGS